jgi:hypothetical protein
MPTMTKETMMNKNEHAQASAEALLSPARRPRIYAYTDTRYPGMIKVGYTDRSVAERMTEHYPTKTPGGASYEVIFDELGMRDDGTMFEDGPVHAALTARGFPCIESNEPGRTKKTEWFECGLDELKAAFLSVQTGKVNIEGKKDAFPMRPEQAAAVAKTVAYFQQHRGDIAQNRRLHFLWNAKMRFGKTFAAYQLAKRMGWTKVLIITFKVAAEGAWRDDLKSHLDFEGWQFYSKNEAKEYAKTHQGSEQPTLEPTAFDQSRPIVCFASFQDLLGKEKNTGANKASNEWIHAKNWDCIIFDEYHYGAWREGAKDLVTDVSENETLSREDKESLEAMQSISEDRMPITTDHFLYLSGTPFRALSEGEFLEDSIFNWTYTDEQAAKAAWQPNDPKDTHAANPYAGLAQMVMMTYQLPPSIEAVAKDGEFNEFSLNTFFKATGDGEHATFVHENAVQQWLHLLRGQHMASVVNDLKQGKDKAPMPFADARLLGHLAHTFWFLSSVAACHAMKNLMMQPQNAFYADYTIIVAAGSSAGLGIKALKPVETAIGNPLQAMSRKTITLSCGKLNTGVSVPAWSGILMLRDTKSPETYFQTAFRVQTPWVAKRTDPNDPKPMVIKEKCYVLDFSPHRAFKQMAEYAQKLDNTEPNPEKRLANLMHFLPVLSYEGGEMRHVNAGDLLDRLATGTSSSMLAKKWSSATLVNVDNNTLERLLQNEEALAAIMQIEGFRALGPNPIGEIVTQAKASGALKPPVGETVKKPRETPIENEIKRKRKLIQEKLQKFATRIPLFMYISDYREYSLHDVITQLEPNIFELVTSLTRQDFALLVRLGVFNESEMNLAVEQFKRFEDASLDYTGIHRSERASNALGLYNTVVQHHEVM